ncbi:Bardet-Biedl syndrome 10 protein [Centropristis striata]|uniref:Bardet-Biedl syndrome 10 protein n=1 Tax=Centropristis striata TaxID=184440 RepID=UPI0027DF8D9A|nr:Bardet-Biedl syndrome 10 protein [Centropristis striata]
MGVGMPLVEHLYLEHVLQSVCVLESVILRSFGPEGGQVLFTRDTGQAMLSRSGTRVLTALRLEHPLARMVVECVSKHSNATGDGSKTFILLLASLLRMIHTTACKEPNVSHTYNSRKAAEAATARHLADEMLAFASKRLDEFIATGVVPYGCCLSWEDFTAKTQSPAHTNNHCVQRLLASFFHTRLGPTHCDFISNLTCKLLTHWKVKNDLHSSSLQFLDQNFAALHTQVSGFPISCSRLIEGQVIHRDFATPYPQTDHQLVKAVIFTGYLQPKLLSAGEVLELGGEQGVEENSRKGRSIVQFSAWAERSLECIIANLQSLGVSVLLSAVKQSAAVMTFAAQAEMCIVECVSEDELSLFARLSGATPVSDCWMIEPEHVATLTFCRPILLGAHRYVHVAFQDSEERVTVKPFSLVICGAGEGQTDQYTSAFQDAIRMLLSTWEPMGMTATITSERTLQPNKSTPLHTDSDIPNASLSKQQVLESGCVIPAGGTFEFLLSHALLQHGSSLSVSDDATVCVPAFFKLLANALLSVPRQIYSHSPRRFLQTQTRFLSLIQNHSHPFSIVNKQEHNTIPTQSRGKSECPLEAGKLTKHCCGEADMSSNVYMSDSGLESISCKYQLLLAVLQCASSLLHVDTVLHTCNSLHTQSRRLKNISWEGTEDEAED